ncbi:MAG: hypothetical protein J6R04_02915 [Clostridia bacterium]|nr:hypothetical protein [Clostridia bacterium]
MKKRIHLTTLLLAILLLSLSLCLVSCYQNDAKDIIGRWRMVSYVTDDGLEAPIDGHELDMVFYSTGIGEALSDGETQYMFDYNVKNGKLNRLIKRSETNVVEVQETYKFNKDRTEITVYSPEDGATIVMEKIEDQVLDRVELTDENSTKIN